MNRNEQYSAMLAGSMMFEAFSRSGSFMTIALNKAKEIEEMMKTEPEGTARIIENEFRGLPVSRSDKAAMFVTIFPNRQFVEYSMQALAARDINTFIALSDLAIGMNLLAQQVAGAELGEDARFEEVDRIVQQLKSELGAPPTDRLVILPRAEDTRMVMEGIDMGARLYQFAYPLTAGSERPA